jgi:hypothetical protein
MDAFTCESEAPARVLSPRRFERRHGVRGERLQGKNVAELHLEDWDLDLDALLDLPPVSIRHRSSARPAAGNDDGFVEGLPIFLLADRIHRPQLR